MTLRDGWFVRVKTAVNAADSVGLLGLGAPKNAYDPEVAELAGMARSGQRLTARVIVAVFDRWFEPGASSLAQAEQIAALLVTWQ
jgi:hypothetical protein